MFLKRVSQWCLNELGLTASQYPNIGLLFFMIKGFEIQSYFLMKDRFFYHTIFFSLPLITYSDHFYMNTLINFYKKLLWNQNKSLLILTYLSGQKQLPIHNQKTGYSHIRMPAFPGPKFYCRKQLFLSIFTYFHQVLFPQHSPRMTIYCMSSVIWHAMAPSHMCLCGLYFS